MKKIRLFFLIGSMILLVPCASCGESGNPATDTSKNTDSTEVPVETPKETYFPKDVWNVDYTNDYQSKTSQFNIYRMKETADFVAFWETGFGISPATTSNTKFRFPLGDLLDESEKMYAFYRDKLKFVEKGNSLTDKYRMVLYCYYNEDGTVYGGGADNKVGVMWLSPGRVQTKPFAAMAHEMGHAFQYMVAVDGAWGFSTSPAGSKGQAIFEMTSQFMLWQFYPNWITFENYHLNTFMLNSHKAFLHEDNRYCAPFVLEYWANKHGIDIIGKIWRQALKGEDPVMTYKRITGIDQKTFNDEMFDASCRFITWDMDRIREVSKNYANLQTSAFTSIGDGWYRIAESRCPQNYGYNGIRLEVPAAGTTVTLDFKGIAGATGYRSVKVDEAGWRYGFLAETADNKRIYGEVHSAVEGQAKFTVPENTAYLWVVVTGAPTEHWEHSWDDYTGNDEQWPYQIKLTGTTLHSTVQKN
ncbi:MAG: DUF6055 domain-containing protein [Bacteroidota bacterium]|nr:DUF6055 domain-containing protein [Bacteroidota bacterium]